MISQPLDLDEAEEKSLLADLLAECETIHGVSCTPVPHENARLNKWYYVQAKASSSTQTHSHISRRRDLIDGTPASIAQAIENDPSLASVDAP